MRFVRPSNRNLRRLIEPFGVTEDEIETAPYRLSGAHIRPPSQAKRRGVDLPGDTLREACEKFRGHPSLLSAEGHKSDD